MGTYWNNSGRLQKEIRDLMAELVPASGKCATREGEMLSAAVKLHYEFHNNGGGNNVSGAMFYLASTLPDFKSEWREALQPFVAGKGRLATDEEREKICAACEEILDTAGEYVIGRRGIYLVTEVEWREFAVRETGFERDEWDVDLDEDEDDYPARGMR